MNFTTVADKVFVSTPPTSAQVGACTQIMMSVSTGSLGAMLIKFRNNWGGSLSVPSLQIYSDNTCTTPLTMTTVGSDKTYTLNATDFPTITSTFTSIFIKDSLPEHVQIGISRVAIPLEPLGFEMNFNPFYASTPSVLSGNYNISNTFNMSFSSMTPGFSITSVDIGGVPCAITVATVSTLTCTIPSNINPLVQLGNKPIYFNMVDGSSNHYNVYSGYDWTFARPPLIIANQQINVMTNSTPNTNIFVDVGPGAPNAGTISCSGALPGSSYFNAGCNLTGYNTATVGTYSVAVTASDNYGSASPVTVIINVISTQAVAPTVTAQSMALGIGVVVANSIVLGGGTPTSCYFSGCTLPPGLGLTNSCQLVGMIPLGTPHGSQACMVNVSNNIGSNAGSIGINW